MVCPVWAMVTPVGWSSGTDQACAERAVLSSPRRTNLPLLRWEDDGPPTGGSVAAAASLGCDRGPQRPQQDDEAPEPQPRPARASDRRRYGAVRHLVHLLPVPQPGLRRIRERRH